MEITTNRTTSGFPVRLIAPALILTFQSIVFLASYGAAPKYVSSLFTQPMGLTMLLGALVWQLLGFWFASQPAGPVASGIKWSAVTILCIVPMFLVPTLGPAVMTIAQALGPVTY